MSKPSKREIYLNNPNLPTVDAQFAYTTEMAEEIRKCKEDVIYFAENYFYIINLDADPPRQKIKLYDFQRESLLIMKDNRFSLFLFSRQIGKTSQSTIFILWQTLFNTDQSVMVVANKETTAKEIFSRIRLAYEAIPNFLKSGVKEYGKESLEFANGSKIKITTTTGTAGRGSACSTLYVDEIDWIEANMLNEFWASVYPIISSSKKSRVIVTSSPNNTSGLFYKLYMGSLNGDNNWKSLTVRWDQVPGRDEKWKKDTMASMSNPALFQREFCCEFDKNGESAIDAEYFDQLKRDCREPTYVFDDGTYLLWELPNPNHIYVAGVDTAEGIKQDSSCIQIIDITDLKTITQVAVYNCNSIVPAQYTTKLNEILEQWGKPLVLIERNNSGTQVADNMKNVYHYENIVCYGASQAGRSISQLGIICHTTTKRRGVINMRYWLNILKCIKINDYKTVLELKSFERRPNQTWGASAGAHDDRVMSLMWALMVLDDEICERYFEIIERDDAQKPALIKLLDYGLKYFVNPTSIYMNEKEGYGDAMPSVFGGAGSSDNTDIDDLKSLGWQNAEELMNNGYYNTCDY